MTAGAAPSAAIRRRITRWERHWRKLLETPEALLLHDRPVPVLAALASRLPTKPFDPANEPDAFRSVLVSRVRLLLPAHPATPDPLFAVLGIKYGADVAGLEHAIHQTPVDPATFGPPLLALVSALDTDTGVLVDAIAAELQAPDSLESRARLLAATEALLRRLVTVDDPKNLARVLEDSLASVGVAKALSDSTAIAAGQALIPDLWAGVRAAARVVADASDLGDRLAAVHDPERELHFLSVHELGRVLAATPAPAAPAPGVGAQTEPVLTDDDAERLGRDMITVWASRWTHWLLGRLTRLQREGDAVAIAFSGRLDALTHQLLGALRALPTISDPSEDEERSDLLTAVSDGTEQVVRETIRKAVVESFRTRYDAAPARPLGHRIAEALFDESHRTGAAWPPSERILRERVALRTAARSDVQRELTGALRAALSSLAAALREAASALAASVSAPTWGDDVAGWEQWTRAVGELAPRWAQAHRCIAWERLADGARAVLQRVVGPLLGATSYEVVLTVEGVDAESEAWDAGGVTWYAADRYNLGERVWDAKRDLRSTLRAWVQIEAATSAHARTRALEIIEAALGTATFLLSVDKRATGFRPVVARYALVGRSDGRAANSWGGREKEEIYDVQSVTKGQFKAVTLDAASLVARVAHPASLTMIDLRLLRAEAWYREGRWDPNPITRFLTYFVALEHIFLAGQQGVKGRLALYVPLFTASWLWTRPREVERIQRIIADAEAARSAATPLVEAVLDADVAMAHWRTDVRPLLARSTVQRAAQQLAAAAGAGDAGAQAFVAFAARLDAFATAHAPFDAARAAARAQWRFTMELLTARRNVIAHEAITGGTDGQIYARELERALAAAIKHLRSVRSAAHLRDVGEAMAWCKPPWLE